MAQEKVECPLFFHNLVILIWPAQLLGVWENAIGTTAAVVLAVGANITLFAIVGLIVGVTGKRWIGLLASYGIVCGFVLVFALWGAGFNVAHLEPQAIAVALMIYAIPFWLVYRMNR